MAFEEFKAKGGKFTPQITINKSGGFGLSSGMHRRYGLDKYGGVKLYFDRDSKKVGIRLIEGEEVGMFKLKKRPNEKGAFFSARSFLEAYALDPKKFTNRYVPEEEEDPQFGKLFTIKLEQRV
jgi:hypothetical protein